MIHLPHIFMVVQPFEMDVSENASVYSAYLAQNHHSHASGKSVFFFSPVEWGHPYFSEKIKSGHLLFCELGLGSSFPVDVGA